MCMIGSFKRTYFGGKVMPEKNTATVCAGYVQISC